MKRKRGWRCAARSRAPQPCADYEEGAGAVSPRRARAPFPCADYEEGAGAPEGAEDWNREACGPWSVQMACVCRAVILSWYDLS